MNLILFKIDPKGLMRFSYQIWNEFFTEETKIHVDKVLDYDPKQTIDDFVS